MESNRFSNVYGKKYSRIIALACPHYSDLQKNIANIAQLNDFNSKQIALEVGTGLGDTTLAVFNALNIGKIISIEKDGLMAKRAEKRLIKYIKSGKIQIVRADALDFLKNYDGSFDLFFSAFTLHNFETRYRDEFLKRLYEKLNYGAMFINGDKYANNKIIEHNLSFSKQILLLKEKIKGKILDATLEHFHEDNSPNRRMVNSKEILKMRNIGFKNIKSCFRNQMELIIYAKK